MSLTPPPLRSSLRRTLIRIGVVLALGYGAHLLIDYVQQHESALSPDAQGRLMLGLLVATLLAYALLIAIPFVPGIEIGLTLIVMQGAAVVPYVYIATVTGLSLAFLAGRFIPYDWLHRVFLDLRMTRACAMIERIKPLSGRRRLALLRQKLPRRLGHLAVRFRYVALALLINLPGSALIGGGGGIVMMAGLSRLFTIPATLLTIVIAVSPVPLIVWMFGMGPISSYIGK
ncbi:hypothetical protein [Pseudogemmobacter sp. W21_MBD1_M6]|uniref:hypothetical protein n=1 Tax=Pseudogemmobacter sp. W21_MBD1_M6 TaxID=3240271 RepID=UPI003F99EE90